MDIDEEDWPMGEDNSILQSTETNGDSAFETVDPSEILLQTSPILLKREQLPFHSPSKPTSGQSSFAQSRGPVMYHSTHSSERVDTARSTPRQRKSPEVRIPPKPRSAVLPYSSSKTGLVYDPRMRFHAELPSTMSSPDDIHPEDPRRIHSIFEEIRQAGYIGSPSNSEEDSKEEHCWRIKIRHATKPEIVLVHTPEHYDYVESLQHMSSDQLDYEANRLDSIYFNHATFECAALAAGGAIEACKAVVQGAVRNAIAIIRPPGHHAESSQPSGFCIFNNVPIAAKVCQADYPETCRKVLILDWDVHHGNGIQHAFYDDPNVLYISLHVFRGGNFYPNMLDGGLDYCGSGAGEGRNVNIPWEDHGMGDAEYIYAFEQVVMPIATEFDPDLVIISAGFDAAEGDLLGGCYVTPACYGHMTHMLRSLANGKVVVCLEGGYNLRSIARSALAVTRVLMLEPPDRLRDDMAPPLDSAVRTIEQVRRQHSKYWKKLMPKHLDKSSSDFHDERRFHELIREWQSLKLSSERAMTPLQINKQNIVSTFEHNVIATADFMGRHPLLVIFHDPPEFQDIPNPVSGRRELHNTWLTDPAKKYIDWAIDNGFEVMDVNIPRKVTDPDDGYADSDDSAVRAAQTRELASYLWENYIEPHDAYLVVFMGIGDAYLGLVDLLSHNDNTTDDDSAVECLIGFVAETTIQSIKRATDDLIGNWYYAHSQIFVKNTHYVWDPKRQRKLRKKLGNLVKSSQDTLDSMLKSHFKEVQDLLLRKKAEKEEEMAEINEEVMSSGLKSPGLQTAGGVGPATPGRDGPVGLKSPKLPVMGYFSVTGHSSPRSPRSSLKKTF